MPLECTLVNITVTDCIRIFLIPHSQYSFNRYYSKTRIQFRVVKLVECYYRLLYKSYYLVN